MCQAQQGRLFGCYTQQAHNHILDTLEFQSNKDFKMSKNKYRLGRGTNGRRNKDKGFADLVLMVKYCLKATANVLGCVINQRTGCFHVAPSVILCPISLGLLPFQYFKELCNPLDYTNKISTFSVHIYKIWQYVYNKPTTIFKLF